VSVVESVYKTCLVTPRVQSKAGKLWRNQGKWWPSKKAEAIVQLNLKAGLAGAFPTCTVREEQPMAEGLLDLEIEQSDPLDRSKLTRHAVLELKVLRTFGETGTPVTEDYTLGWVKSGVTQAHAFRRRLSGDLPRHIRRHPGPSVLYPLDSGSRCGAWSGLCHAYACPRGPAVVRGSRRGSVLDRVPWTGDGHRRNDRGARPAPVGLSKPMEAKGRSGWWLAQGSLSSTRRTSIESRAMLLAGALFVVAATRII
jgi:hypothetical protein